MKLVLPTTLALLLLAGCGPSTPASPSASTTPGSTTFDGLTLLVDGQPASYQHTLITNTSGTAGALSHAYLIGLGSGQTVDVGGWAATAGYAASGTTHTVTLSLTQRAGTGASDVSVWTFESIVQSDGATPLSIPAGTKVTYSENGGKLDFHLTGSATALGGSKATHQFDATLTGLPL